MPGFRPSLSKPGARQALRYSTVCAIGDSITAGSANGNSYYSKLLSRAGQFQNKGSFAVAGTRSDEILATQVPQAIASGAQFCFTQFGTNDVAQSVAESTLRANAITIWARLRAAGIEPIDVSLLPHNTAANAVRHAAHNVWRKLYCLKNGITHIDVWPLLATSAGAFASGMNVDATHPSTSAAIAMANKVAARMASPWLVDPLLALTDTGSDTATFINNAVSFTDSNADGVPNSWFSSGTGGTYTIQAADSGDFGSWARCAMSAGTNVGMSATAVTLASLGWAIGDTIAVGMRYRWSDSSQALTNNVYYTGATMSGSAQPLFQEKGGASGDSLYVYVETTIASGTNINLQPFASGTGYFEINRPIVVNLTSLGLA